MKIKDVAKAYRIDQSKLESYLRKQSELQFNYVLSGMVIDDGDVDLLIDNFKQEEKRLAKEQSEEEERLAKEQSKENERLAKKQAVLSNMLITSGFNFDGYTITKYSGYISGDDVISIDRGRGGLFFNSVTNVRDSLLDSLAQLRRTALAELKEAAYALGCNAVIGVDFDYLTLAPETYDGSSTPLYLPYIFAVTANGNAVIIEKNTAAG